mgnify:CR=1 FL=1
MHQQEAAIAGEFHRQGAGRERDDAGERGDAVQVADVERHPDEAGMDAGFVAEDAAGHVDAGDDDVMQHAPAQFQ